MSKSSRIILELEKEVEQLEISRDVWCNLQIGSLKREKVLLDQRDATKIKIDELEQKVEKMESERDCNNCQHKGVSEVTCGACKLNNFKFKQGAENE